MKTFSISFSITLLLICPMIYTMDTYQKTMYLQQEQQCLLTSTTHMPDMPDMPICTASSQRSDSLNAKDRRNFIRKITHVSTLENSEHKKSLLIGLQAKLLHLKRVAPEKLTEKNQQWLDQQLKELENLITACNYNEPKVESTDLQDMSQTVLLQQEFLTLAQEIAQKELQLNQKKREAEHYKSAYKERLLKKQESLVQNAESATQKEQKLHAQLLKIQQELNTTQLHKQEVEQQLRNVESHITIIESYTPQSQVLPVSDAEYDAELTEPTDDIQLDLSSAQSSTKNPLSSSCTLQ